VANRLNPTATRLALAAASLGIATAIAEAGLRGSYPTLPSLAALHDRPDLMQPFLVEAGQRRRDDRVCDQVVREPRGRDVSYGSAEPVRTLWFVGDSMTSGMGVEPGQEWPAQLAQRLQDRTQGQVVVRNLALPGVGYCEVLRRAHSELQFGRPDLVFIALFADDLESRALLARDGRLVGLPHTIESDALRWAARRSYAVNLGWFAMAGRPEGPVRFIDGPGRAAFQRNVAALTDKVRALGAEPVVVLMEPVGAASCADALAADPTHRCGWMADDLSLMATLLDEVGVEAIDTRGLWSSQSIQPSPSERDAAMAIHPDGAGHAAFAEHLLDRLGPEATAHSHTGGTGDVADRR